MSSSRAICFVLALCGFDAAVASDIHCPAVLKSGGKSKPLQDASVFSGPPEELAELIPDLDTSEWDIAQDQLAAKGRGQSMYFVCHYEHSKKTVQLLIPPNATVCKVEGTISGGTAAWCKAEVRQSSKSNSTSAHGHQS